MTRATLVELKRIKTDGGEVLRALRSDEPEFSGFEEAYFSRVNPGSVRGWKQHKEMTVNVVVPVGHVRFVVRMADNRFDEYDLGPDHTYGRLAIEPGTWFGFKGGDEGGLVLNLSNVLHRADEVDSRDLASFDYQW